jgi:P27 family predicted phage terminase small subunit
MRSNVYKLKTSPTQPNNENLKGDLFQGLVGTAPSCPAWLSKDAKKHFRFLVGELRTAGLIAKIDEGALCILATAYAGMKEAEIETQEKGQFQATPNGYQQLTPWAIQYDRYSKQYEKLCTKFAITVSGRQRSKIENPNQGSLDL